MLAAHSACTEARLRAYPRVLCVQDTTELDYTKKKGIAGLGPLNYPTRWGMYLHPTLALTPERVPLGLLDLHRLVREPGRLGQEKDPNRPLEEKESVRWVDGFARVNALAERLPETRLTSRIQGRHSLKMGTSAGPAARDYLSRSAPKA